MRSFLLLRVALVLCTVSALSAQQVSFSNHSKRLYPVSGFTLYSDCSADMDGDHLDDVVRVGREGIYVDFQQPGGSFVQRFFPLPVQAPPSWSICAGDLDNDGLADLLLADSAAVSFVRASEGGSGYTETLMPGDLFCQRSTLADVDNDGWLDGFVCNDRGQSIPYRNDGAGRIWPDQSLILTADRPGNYSAIWTDYDNDGDSDLYLSKCLAGSFPGNINRTNLLYRKNADGSFSEVGAQAGLDDNAQSWSTVFEDFDNDGDFDAFVINHDFQNRLFRNNGDSAGMGFTFTDVIAASGIAATDLGAWENAAGDFNNDGFVDIFSELKQELYLGKGDFTFTGQDAPVKPGAVADLNDDGFLDVIRKGQLWLNDGNANHWLKVVPLGTKSNRNGIGARVEIFGPWGRQMREQRAGQSFSPMNSLTLHFGLGQHLRADSLLIRWPSGMLTRLYGLSADSTYVVPEAPCLLPAAALTLSDSSTLLCPGDTLQLLAPEGFASYAWSNRGSGPKLSVSAPGRYFALLGDEQGCVAMTQTVHVQMREEKPPSISSPMPSTMCAGDTLTLYALPEGEYSWSNGETGVSSISITQGGVYTVAASSLCSSMPLVSPPLEVTVLPAPPPVAASVSLVAGDSVLLSATGEACHWYDQADGGTLLGSGPTLQTAPLHHDTAFFVESHLYYPGEAQQGGKSDTTGAGGISTQTGYLHFRAWSPFILSSVTVYVPAGAPLNKRFVQLWSPDTLLAVKQFAVQPGENVLPLDFQVPVGEFTLRCQQGNLFRNRGPLQYPYPIGHVGEITTSSFGETLYFYFYDWRIRTLEHSCISPRTRVSVSVTHTDEPSDEGFMRVHPNPSCDLFLVQTTGHATLYRVVDAAGRTVKEQHLGAAEAWSVCLDGLPPGAYALQVFGEGWSGSAVLLKQ